MATDLDSLRGWLNQQSPRTVSNKAELAGLLIAAWDEIQGSDDQSTDASNFARDIENPEWQPPNLRYEVERHGITVTGSKRATIIQWIIDVINGTARCNPNYRLRQLRPNAKNCDR